MSNAAIITIAVVLGVVALAVIFRHGRSLASGKINLFGAKAGMKGQPTGASAVGAKAGRDLNVDSAGPGAAVADHAEAGRDIKVTSRNPQ